MTKRSDLTERLCSFAASLRFVDLPAVAASRATAAIADTIGCALAGIASPSVAPILGIVMDEAGAEQASIFGRAERVPASAAALVNGAAAHSLDFDDISRDLCGHPSAVLVPALFASAEKIGAHGKDVVCAYVAGYEIAAVIGRRLNPSHYDRGWHATATIGSLAAAGAVANLLHLPAEQMRHALSIAASQAGGMRRQFGTDAKPLHAGLAARAGVLSAGLAARGMKADPAILDSDGPAEDDFPALYGGPSHEGIIALEPEQKELAIVARGLQVKRHACCAATHTSIDALLQLFAENDLRPENVEAIECRVNRIAADVLKYHVPLTPLEAKFSLEFCVAVAALAGDCGISQFTQARVDAAAVRELASRVVLKLDPALPHLGTTPCRVTIRTRDGRTLTAELTSPKGSPDFPLTPDELRRKFLSCAVARLPHADAARLFDRLLDLQTVRDVSEVTTLTRGAMPTRPGVPGGVARASS